MITLIDADRYLTTVGPNCRHKQSWILQIMLYIICSKTNIMLLNEVEEHFEINTSMFTKLDLVGRGRALKCQRQHLSLTNDFRGN